MGDDKTKSKPDDHRMPGWLGTMFVASLLVPVALFSWALEHSLWALVPMALLAAFWFFVIRRYLSTDR